MDPALPIAVVVADPPGPARAALAGLIAAADGLSLSGEVSTAAELYTVVHERRPDVILLDDRLLRDGALPAAQLGAAVVITGVDDDLAYAQRARRFGAAAWVAKDQPDEILAALRAAGYAATAASLAATG